MKRNILLVALLLAFVVSGLQAQNNEETGQTLRKELSRALVRNSPYDGVSSNKSEILMLEVEIGKAGKIGNVLLLSNYLDTPFKNSLEGSLNKAKESIAIPNAVPGTYPVLLCFINGDEDEHLFNTSSIMGAIKVIQEKYRSYKQDPLVVIVSRSTPKKKS